jgi:hypothetical protein
MIKIVGGFGRLSRGELAATVCESLPWKAPSARLKVNGCRLLLEEMNDGGLIVLPPKRKRVEKTICNTQVPPLPDADMESLLSLLSPITVDPVFNKEIAIWNATMAAHHPLGMGQPFGMHQRYWIRGQAEGTRLILGGILFAAPAKVLANRDNWIGWIPLAWRRF